MVIVREGSVRTVRQRRPLPDLPFNAVATLSASLVAAVTYVLALSVGELPQPAFSIILFTAAALAALVALPVVALRGRAQGDPGLQWAATGLAVASLALVLQLISFPAVVERGGALGTSRDANAALYLLFHVWCFGCAAAGALRAPAVLRRVALGAGTALCVALAVDLVPVPALLSPDQTFTPLLRVAEGVLCLLGVGSVALWVVASGRRPAPLTGWIGVSLVLLAYELAVNAVAGQRYTALWWSSLSLRAAAFGVLAAGAMSYLLQHVRRLETYSDAELVLRDAELTSRVEVIDQLLTTARRLASAQTPTDVARVLCEAARRVTGAAVVAVSHYDRDRQAWVRLACEAADGEIPAGGGPLAPSVAASVDATGVYARTSEDLPGSFPPEDPPPEDPPPGDPSPGDPPPVGTPPDGTPPGEGASTGARRTVATAVLPLRVRGVVAGVLEVAEYGPRVWSQADRELLQGLADQGGPSLSRSRLALREHQAAETLQRSLLPARLPQPPGLVLSAVYQPAVRDDQVGGDWYDSWTLPDGRVALVIGDVVGKGLAAAATTGRLRASIRALAAGVPDPAPVLTRLDELEAEDGGRMVATATYVLLDAGMQRARIARAGHPPPVLVAPDAPPRLLLHDGGAPIGVGAGSFTEMVVPLRPGSALLLYTDGLVEDRSNAVDAQLDRLLDVVADCVRDLPPSSLPEALMARFEPAGDDVAILVAARS